MCDVKISDDSIWKDLTVLCVNALLNDKELPVKVQAGLAIQALLTAEEKVKPLLVPQVYNKFFIPMKYLIFIVTFPSTD